MKIILISGPPGAGKDTVGEILALHLGLETLKEKFAQPLMDAAFSLGFTQREDDKDLVDPFFGMSRREFQIKFSEDFCKPLLGPKVFGLALAARLLTEDNREDTYPVDWAIVTDSGFRPEAEAVVNTFGSSNVIRMHVTRPGHDYSRDSRSDWPDIEGVRRVTIVNDGDKEQLVHNVINAIAPFTE